MHVWEGQIIKYGTLVLGIGVITSTRPTVTQPHPGICVWKCSDVTAAAPSGRSCVAAVAAERT